MNPKIYGLLFVVLAAVVLFAPFGATPLFAAGELGDSFPEAPLKSDVVPGEYLIFFKARESVLALEGQAKIAAVAMMLEIQAEILALKYGVTVENTYSAISEANGKGMFFVRSEKAAEDSEFASKLLEEMGSDPMIEGAYPNKVQKGISVPQVFSTKRRCIE